MDRIHKAFYYCFLFLSLDQRPSWHHIRPFNSLSSQQLHSQNKNMGRFFFFSLLSLLVIFPTAIPQTQSKPVTALSLYTNSRWIVDEGGQRVKLSCVNWVSHLEPVVTDGLSKQPMDAISKKIASMGFNCVRLTWPLFLVTNDSLASLTVRQSCQNLGLSESIAGIQANNPSIIDLPFIKAYQVKYPFLPSESMAGILMFWVVSFLI